MNELPSLTFITIISNSSLFNDVVSIQTGVLNGCAARLWIRELLKQICKLKTKQILISYCYP